MVSNNLQDPGNKNAAPSAGKYLVYASIYAQCIFVVGIVVNVDSLMAVLL